MPPDSDTSTLAYLEEGSGERIVVVHGFSQSARSYATIAAALAANATVCAVDLPGHGGSRDVNAPDLETTADLLGDVGGRATYIGYSLGGRVTLTLAHRRPDLVEKMVLVGTTAGIADAAERAARRAADERLADRLDPPDRAGLDLEVFLDEWLGQPLFVHLSPNAQDRAARRVNTTLGLARSLRTTGTGTQRPSYDRLGELEMPTLLVAGARDTKFAAIAREMAELIGENATIALVDGAGHAVPFEQTEQFVALVTAWLAIQL